MARRCRVAAACFAAALVTATHWPALRIDGPVDRTDLVLHAAAFGALTLLVIGCRLFGTALSRRNIAISGAAVAAFAALDEVTQGIPVLQRTPDPLDWIADAAGVLVACGAGMIAERRLSMVGRS